MSIGRTGGPQDLGPIDEPEQPDASAPSDAPAQAPTSLPRSGWSSQDRFSAIASKVKASLDDIEETVTNWRTGRAGAGGATDPNAPPTFQPMYGVFRPVPEPPIRPLYGVFGPPGPHPTPTPAPTPPPHPRPLYGMFPPVPTPTPPPHPRPLYGVFGPTPTPHPPITPLYGVFRPMPAGDDAANG